MVTRVVRGEGGVTVLPLLVVVVIISAIGFGLVGVMNTDITHATIQGAVSRSFFITQAGVHEAIVRLKANALYRTVAYPSGVSPTAFGSGEFRIWVEDYAEDTVQITVRGRGVSAGRAAASEVRVIALVGPPITFGLFGVSTVGAQGATSRTYLAPWRPTGPGEPRAPNAGSFLDIHFQDTGIRLNAVSETSPDTVTLRDGTFNDWALYGFASQPAYDPNAAEPWILAAFGDIVKAQPDTGAVLHPCDPPTLYACLTKQASPVDIPSMYQLRETENMKHVYMSRVRKRVLPRAYLSSEPLLAEATDNTANASVNTAAGISHGNAVYTAAEFASLVTYLNNNPGQVVKGTLYVTGNVQIGHNLTLSPTLNDGTLAVEGNLTLATNKSLTIRHGVESCPVVGPCAAREKVALAVFPGGGLTGRFIMQGGPQQRFTADGLVYTSDGMVVDPQAMVDLVGAMYHGSANNSVPSYLSKNATTVIRFDPLATTPLLANSGAIGVTILSWQQMR